LCGGLDWRSEESREPVMTTIELHVPGIPQQKGSLRAFRKPRSSRLIVTSANPKLKAWEQGVYAAALAVRPRTRFLGPLAVTVTFTFPRPKSAAKRALPAVRPDLDKLVRGCLDPLSGVIFNDDAQVVRVEAAKVYCAEGESPGAQITVRVLG
jgi:crossover junction endodeoxyribonuclease RusA